MTSTDFQRVVDGRPRDAELAAVEPSHIHIPRPGRVLKRYWRLLDRDAALVRFGQRKQSAAGESEGE